MAPTWMNTVTRPAAFFTTVSATSSRSSALMRYISPVVPQGYRHCTPFWIRYSVCASSAATSTLLSAVKGVVMAVITPYNFFIGNSSFVSRAFVQYR